MLNAILHGKKRGSGTAHECLATTFDGAEDTLTASVFERLFYLPDELVTRCLFHPDWWLPDPPQAATIRNVRFWPRHESVHSSGTIEPDVEIEFTDGILVIEAKRRDHARLQNIEQLAKEWVCAQDEFPGKSIHLLAVGGLADGTPASASTLRERVANEIVSLTGKPASFRFAAVPWGVFTSRILTNLSMLASERHAGFVRLADDLRAASLLHGVSPDAPVWLADLGSALFSGCRGLRSSSINRWVAEINPIGRTATSTEMLTLNQLSGAGGIATSPTYFFSGGPEDVE